MILSRERGGICRKGKKWAFFVNEGNQLVGGLLKSIIKMINSQ